jgi:prepilin-type N-terminal cleavage/methylation domain-containing protein
MSGDNDGQAGVTLVEMLVVLALLVLVSGFIAGGLQAVKLSLPLATRMTRGDELAAAREHLRNTIAETVAQSLLQEELFFRGDEHDLSFTAAADPVFETSGLIRVMIRAEPTATGSLALVERRTLDRNDKAPATGQAILLDNIASVTFQFFKDGTAVQDIKKGDPLPDLLRISVSFPKGDQRQFAPLDIALICAPRS